MEIAFPYRLDPLGTAQADADRHLRDQIEQVLFTAPGERVNRPDFGCGLLELVFESADDALAAALQWNVQAALQRFLGERLELETLRVDQADGKIVVQVSYFARHDPRRRVDTFVRER